jgi:hypothetical protein
LRKSADKKKGPLALASGPSLGRKRPRRAATARSAIALQQYAAASHQKQALFVFFLCRERMACFVPMCDMRFKIFIYNNGLLPIMFGLDTTESHRQARKNEQLLNSFDF